MGHLPPRVDIPVQWLLAAVSALWVLVIMTFTPADATCTLAWLVCLGMNLWPDVEYFCESRKAVGIYPLAWGNQALSSLAGGLEGSASMGSLVSRGRPAGEGREAPEAGRAPLELLQCYLG